MEKEFLQSVNLDLLKSELKIDVNELSRLLDVSTQTIYKWAREKDKGGCRPTYDSIIILLKHGASLKSLFGIENYSGPMPSNSSRITDEEFMAGVRAALKDLASK